MGKAAVLVIIVCILALSVCQPETGSLESHSEPAVDKAAIGTGKERSQPESQDQETEPLNSPENGGGGEEGEMVDTEQPRESEPTTAAPEVDDTCSYILSRLTDVDSAIHRLNVAHYTLDVKMAQMADRVTGIAARLEEVWDTLELTTRISQDSRKEIGRLEGCLKGRRVGYKCFLIIRLYESYAGALKNCQDRGGRLAMPRDRKEQEALAEYCRGFFHPGNWPLWLGISDQRSEDLYLFEDGTRVTFFYWRKSYLSSQPDGGRRENCVGLSSDDGDWWDNDCERLMYFVCEFDT